MSSQHDQIELLKTLCQCTGTLKVETEQELAEFLEDVNKIVRCSCGVRIGNQASFPGTKGAEVQISGVCEFGVLYQSGRRNGEGRLCYCVIPVEFTYTNESAVDELFDGEDLWVISELKPENVVCRPLGPRKLQLRCDLAVSACVKGNVLCSAWEEEGAALETKRESVNASRLRRCFTKEMSLKEEIVLPREHPAVATLADCDADLFVQSAVLSEDRVVFSLLAVAECSYLPEEDPEAACTPVSFLQPLEIKDSLEAPDCASSQLCSLQCHLADLKVSAAEDTGGEQRKIVIEMSYLVCAAVYENQQIECLVDCYSTEDEIRFEKEKLETENIVSDFQSSAWVEASVALKEPEIERLEMIRATVSTGKCLAQKQGIRMQGDLKLSMLGIKSDGQTLALKEEVKFDTLLNAASGAESFDEGAPIHLELLAGVQEIECEIQNGEIRIRALVQAQGLFTQKKTLARIVDLQRIGKSQASQRSDVIVYYPEKGEDAWEIGKRFLVPMQRLYEEMEENEGRLPSVLTLIC